MEGEGAREGGREIGRNRRGKEERKRKSVSQNKQRQGKVQRTSIQMTNSTHYTHQHTENTAALGRRRKPY